MNRNAQIIKLLRAVREATGYRNLHKWEAGTDYDKDNTNRPFKPQFIEGGPWGEDFEKRADGWDGGLMDWKGALEDARAGHVIDFYVSNREELETNVEVWIKNEREAVWSDCGSKPRTITI